MQRLTTDFLSEASSFVKGVGSVMNIAGCGHDYNSSTDPDKTAIAHDWHMVGQDIRDAMQKADATYGSAKPRK